MNPLQDTEGLIYSVGALKFLSINLTLLREVSSSKGIEIICHHMKTINDYVRTVS